VFYFAIRCETTLIRRASQVFFAKVREMINEEFSLLVTPPRRISRSCLDSLKRLSLYFYQVQAIDSSCEFVPIARDDTGSEAKDGLPTQRCPFFPEKYTCNMENYVV